MARTPSPLSGAGERGRLIVSKDTIEAVAQLWYSGRPAEPSNVQGGLFQQRGADVTRRLERSAGFRLA